MTRTRQPARVCVSAARKTNHTNRQNGKPPYSGGLQRKETRYKHPYNYYTTTTSYTLQLVSSSIRSLPNSSLTLRGGGCGV